jgi:hypothetical protein
MEFMQLLLIYRDLLRRMAISCKIKLTLNQNLSVFWRFMFFIGEVFSQSGGVRSPAGGVRSLLANYVLSLEKDVYQRANYVSQFVRYVCHLAKCIFQLADYVRQPAEYVS